MSGVVISNIVRFFLLFGLQVLVLKRLSLGWEGVVYVNILIYPLYFFLLPLRTPSTVVIFLAFVMGLLVDMVYDSPGVHASASVFTAFIRPFALSWVEPRDGYNVNHSPTARQYGNRWFFWYATILLSIHLFFYFSVEAFTFVYIFDIILKTLFSYPFSIAFIFMYMLLFNPKE